MAALTAQQVAQIAYGAGFRDADLVAVVAIAGRESKYDPSAHNTNATTGDDSYGLMQINMRGSLGPERRKLFGITTDAELFDPVTNMRAAYTLYKRSGLEPWGGYKGRSNTYGTDMNAAAAAVQAATAAGTLAKPYSAGQGAAPAGTIAANGDPEADNGAQIQLAKLLWLVRAAGITDDERLTLYGAAAHAASGIPGFSAVNLYDDGKTSHPPSGIGAWGLQAAEAEANRNGADVKSLRTAAGNVRLIMAVTKNGTNLEPLNRWKSSGTQVYSWTLHVGQASKAVATIHDYDKRGENPWYFPAGSAGAVTEEAKIPGVSSALELAGKALATITSAAFWQRAGFILLGAVLVILAIVILVKGL